MSDLFRNLIVGFHRGGSYVIQIQLFRILADIISNILECKSKYLLLQGKTVTLKLKTVGFDVKTRAHTLAEHTADKDTILQAATDLLKTEIQACYPQPLRLRLMGKLLSLNYPDYTSTLIIVHLRKTCP